jgi:hypothetical protein
MNYYQKYLKYKEKYLSIKKQYGGIIFTGDDTGETASFWIIQNNGEEPSRYSGQCIWISIRDFLNYNAIFNHNHIYTIEQIRDIATFKGNAINGEREYWDDQWRDSLIDVLTYCGLAMRIYFKNSDETIHTTGFIIIGDETLPETNIINIVHHGLHFDLITKINDQATMSLTFEGQSLEKPFNPEYNPTPKASPRTMSEQQAVLDSIRKL